MSKKLPYYCKDLDDRDLLKCRDFTPSALRDTEEAGSKKAYRTYQEKCKKLAAEGRWQEYEEERCKREAHFMVPKGRGALRYGLDHQPTHDPKSGEPYEERLRDLRTPLTERTQSTYLIEAEEALREAKGVIEGGANARLLEALSRETKRGEVHLEPKVDPAWFTREIEKAEQELEDARGKRQKAKAKALVWELKRRHATFLRRVGKIGRRRVVPETRGATLPDHVLALIFIGELGEALGKKIHFEPTGFGNVDSPRPKSPVGIYGPTNRVRPGGERIEALKSGDSEVEVKYLLRKVLWRMRAQEGEKKRLIGGGRLGLMTAGMQMREWLAGHPPPEEEPVVEVVLEKRDGGTRVVKIPWSKLQHSIVPKGADKTRGPDYKRLRNLTIRDLAEGKSYQPRRKRRGRRLRPLPKARRNPMADIVINEADFTSLAKGDFVELPSRPGKVIYKNSKGELKMTTRKRAEAWQAYGEVAKEIRPAARALREDEDAEIYLTTESGTDRRLKRPRKRTKSQHQLELLEPLEAAANPKERKMARRRSKFDPLAELMKEFGPAKRRKVKRGSPKSARQTYDQQLGPYGARAAIPVNRRNPKRRKAPTGTPAQKRWKALFGDISKRASQIQADKGCSYKMAFDQARREIAPDYVAASAKANRGHRLGGEFRRQKRRGPGRKSHTWNYEQAIGPYGSERSIPQNRRNPAGGVTTARFPSQCVICGEAFETGHSQIVDSGIRGPRGGRKMAHVECA